MDPINAGLRHARGEWIARIDDDDEWRAEHLSWALFSAKQLECEFISFLADGPKGEIREYTFKDGTKVGSVQTWLYKSYLKVFKFNIHAWRKPWNRNNDTDFQDRIWKAGVKMDFVARVAAHIRPRAGELHIGSKAYRLNAAEVEERMKFL